MPVFFITWHFSSTIISISCAVRCFLSTNALAKAFSASCKVKPCAVLANKSLSSSDKLMVVSFQFSLIKLSRQDFISSLFGSSKSTIVISFSSSTGICKTGEVITIFFKYFCRIFEDELINSYLLQIGSFIVYCLILIFIEISILILFDKNKQKQFLASLIYFCGFISRFIMMFSPTVFASGERTSLFFYISLIILNIIFIKMIKKPLHYLEK